MSGVASGPQPMVTSRSPRSLSGERLFAGARRTDGWPGRSTALAMSVAAASAAAAEQARTVTLSAMPREWLRPWRPEVAMPDGLRHTSIAAEPALLDSLYAACCEIYADLPDPEPVVIGTLEEWHARDIEAAGQPLDGVLIAAAGDEVVGVSRVVVHERGRVVGHLITGVRRDWRGRGVALALKRAAIGWAIDRGAEWMSAENAVHNEPMRAINAALGFQPGADFVELREDPDASTELAGRGLYGDYILQFDREDLTDDARAQRGLDLGQVDDILIRLEYVSVAKPR